MDAPNTKAWLPLAHALDTWVVGPIAPFQCREIKSV
jgi:hypothetical protein